MRGRHLLLSSIKKLLSIFLPFRCHVCSSDTDFGLVLCQTCRNRLQQIISRPLLSADVRCDFPVYTLSCYDSFVADIIKIIKYRPSARLLKILAEECLREDFLSSLIKPTDVLIPVPMHADRLAERGFNQAAYLAEKFAGHCGCNFSPAMIRSRATRPQADCDEIERLTNLDQAFQLHPQLNKKVFRSRRIFLIDDVATTGTTLQKCAEVLKTMAPSEILALTVSHSFRRSAKSP